MKHCLSKILRNGLCATLLAASGANAWADALTDALVAQQRQWDHIQYEMPAEQRTAAFEKLSVEAAPLVQQHPDRAEAHAWQGITLASWARADGGLGALPTVRQARDAFNKAVAIDPKVMGGAAYYGLGGLYANVPRWPIGFGDKTRAEEMFKQGVATAPQGLDSNYYYGDFLVTQNRPKEARPYLERALQAPLRPGREMADKNRHAKVEQLLKDLPAN